MNMIVHDSCYHKCIILWDIYDLAKIPQFITLEKAILLLGMHSDIWDTWQKVLNLVSNFSGG